MPRTPKTETTASSTLRAVRVDLHSRADADDAANLMRFFKTAPGQYGHGDRFLGIRVPVLRQLARTHRSLPVDDALTLLASKWHEERSLALFLLVGWMLREIGKRDGNVERLFLDKHGRTMPRTMLRYAIEKFPEAERRRYMQGTPNA